MKIITLLRSFRLWRTQLALAVMLLIGLVEIRFSVASEPDDQIPETQVVETQIDETPLTDSDLDHWSLYPIQRPALPKLGEAAKHCRTGIDYFVLAPLVQQGESFSTDAKPSQLLRRLCFDLHGLPPTFQELRAFSADEGDDAYEQLVERKLGSPQYGERWAQHWLELARYAETDGFEHDKVRPGSWRYRDWVIQALNQDLPYDEFIRQQIAGDLLGNDAESAMPTMFCLAGPDMPDINEQDVRRHDKLNEITATIGESLLGLQLKCAQCHDHKYDPISQADFYRLRAVFEPAIPIMKRDKHVLSLEDQENPFPGKIYHRGELSGAGAELRPGFPRLAVGLEHQYLCDADQNSRLQFAEWLFDRNNPLTARVIANRIWQHHFGVSLCENPSDFGVVAGEPSHPMLLDWLASELVDSGWSIKHLHRMILLSTTYRQQGRTSENALSGELEPDTYAFFPGRRLDGESLRDAMLRISGRIVEQVGGTSVYPPLPPELVSTLLKNQWKVSDDPADHCRRSIYTFARRNLRYPIFDVFDRPSANASCAVRNRSTTPIQALLMLNSEFSLKCAQALARELIAEFPRASSNEGECSELIESLFQRTISRSAEHAELERFRSVLKGEGFEANLTVVCIGLFNSNEFVYID